MYRRERIGEAKPHRVECASYCARNLERMVEIAYQPFDQVAASIRGIGMSHVEGSGDGRQLDLRLLRRVSDALTQFGWHVLRKRVQPDARQIEL